MSFNQWGSSRPTHAFSSIIYTHAATRTQPALAVLCLLKTAGCVSACMNGASHVFKPCCQLTFIIAVPVHLIPIATHLYSTSLLLLSSPLPCCEIFPKCACAAAAVVMYDRRELVDLHCQQHARTLPARPITPLTDDVLSRPLLRGRCSTIYVVYM